MWTSVMRSVFWPGRARELCSSRALYGNTNMQRSKTMDFSLNDEQKMVQQTVRDFVNRELIPLEGDVLRNEREGKPGLEREKIRELQQRAKDMGFWGINTPEEYGGANLGPIMTAIITMEVARTFVPFNFGGTADNILYYFNEEQKQRMLSALPPKLKSTKVRATSIVMIEIG